MIAKKIVVELSVAAVQSGGNAGGGKYFYSFSEDVILVTEPNTPMEFRLSADTMDNFTIKSVVSSDISDQFIGLAFGGDKRDFSMTNRCDRSLLINVAVLVLDNKTQKLVLCDPQVLNTPDRPPI